MAKSAQETDALWLAAIQRCIYSINASSGQIYSHYCGPDRKRSYPYEIKGRINKDGYRQIVFRYNGAKHSIYKHRAIMVATMCQVLPEDCTVDHRDLDKQNNKISNLRLATRQQQIANTIARSKSGYKGVYVTPDGKYEASIRYKGKSQYLGRYTSPVEAAIEYDTMAKKLFGDFANTNFS